MQPDPSFFTILGAIAEVQTFDDCSLIMSVKDVDGGIVHLVVDGSVYVVDMEELSPGDSVLAYCDSSSPVPLVYPPRYRPSLMVRPERSVNYDFDSYGRDLVNSQGTLKLQIGSDTEVILPNGQPFHGPLNGKTLLVEYKYSTRSVPALTMPKKVIAFCPSA